MAQSSQVARVSGGMGAASSASIQRAYRGGRTAVRSEVAMGCARLDYRCRSLCVVRDREEREAKGGTMATTRSTKREKRAPHRRATHVRVKSMRPHPARNVWGGNTD